MLKKSASQTIERIKSVLTSPVFMEKNRTSNQNFTRKRKLPFVSLFCFMLSGIKQSIQKGLTDFIQEHTAHKNMTKSAFCQQRVKLKPESFVELNQVLVDDFYTDNEYATHYGRRLLCIDGSTLELPRSPEIIDIFGVNNNDNMIPMSRISTMYDPLNNLIIDGKMDANTCDEYTLAVMLLENIKEDDLIILDRGYGARWLFYLLQQKKANYVVRVQRNFGSDVDSFWDSKEKERIVEVKELPKKSKVKLHKLGVEFKPFTFRLVKIMLNTGEVEVLATSLLDFEKFNLTFLKETYELRWGIEVNYDHLKNHIELGNFTGYSVQAVKQDFFANILLANIQALLVLDAQAELSAKNEAKSLKYEYKINKNLSLGFLKERVVDILMSNKPEYFEELKALFQIEPSPIRKWRKFPRERQRTKRKFYMNQRRAT